MLKLLIGALIAREIFKDKPSNNEPNPLFDQFENQRFLERQRQDPYYDADLINYLKNGRGKY